ncbi:hypothetical protein [Sediminicurvatus halobius]|uniref:Uncharacterized protein n=1 Tax=Sediminicurvatus halobius TaxID=2182432 RepID=A0A2U2N1A7_9GAMM|nr:hypothetical protein [Spiribacter halobius]PWG62852.1 hypothetical protein DEM34_10825 [Spiribacter halobius]UEX76997.1 hypothetical protein LMH63_13725 [Spiribacter halobius]
MSTAHFTLTYDGPALQEHEIDARELAPALIAVSDTLEAANAALNGDQVRVQVNVRASFRTGCFGIDFSVVQSLSAQLTSFLNSEAVSAAINLVTLLGMGGTGAFGLVKAIRRLRGRAPRRVIELKDGRFRIETDDGHFEIEAEVLELLRNYEVRKGLEGVVKPLDEEGIEQVAFQADQDTEPEIIRKDERRYFRAPPPEQEELEERDEERYLQLVSLSFKEENKWRFNDGNATFHAAILDEDFLRRIDLGEERFGKNDVLKVRMRTRQFIDTSGNMRSEAEVLQVLEKHSAGRQLRLDITRGEDPPAES